MPNKSDSGATGGKIERLMALFFWYEGKNLLRFRPRQGEPVPLNASIFSGAKQLLRSHRHAPRCYNSPNSIAVSAKKGICDYRQCLGCRLSFFAVSPYNS